MTGKILRLPALILLAVMVISLFAGCAGTGNPEETTAGTTEATTKTTADTTPDMGGYVFQFANAYYINPDSAEYANTAKKDELQSCYNEIETTYKCEIEFVGTTVEYADLYKSVMSGVKHSDFANIHQTAWIPLAVQGLLRPLETQAMLDAGLDVNDSDCFFQLYTHLSDLAYNGETHTWAVDMSGKYDHMYFGHTYAFNKNLLNSAGYSEDYMFNLVFEHKWTYEKMIEIATAVRKDIDNDGTADIWGVALDCDGNEIWTNGTGPIIYNSTTNKWVSNIKDARITESLDFMAQLNSAGFLSPTLTGDGVASRSDRRTLFYSGKAAFAGLYGKNFGNDGGAGTASMSDDAGLLPIPMGPDASEYKMNFVDADVYCMLVTASEWEKAAFIMNEVGRRVHDDQEYMDYLFETCLLNDQNSFKVLSEYLLPNGNMNIAKCSEDMYVLTRTQFYADVYAGTKTPTQAAEAYNSLIQAELDKIFKQ